MGFSKGQGVLMKRAIRSVVLVWTLAVVGVARAETATNIVNGVTTNHSGFFYVGQTGPDNVLVITNGGRLRVSPGLGSSIGEGDSADRNSALVTGSGSFWQAGYLDLGYEGATNTLTVTNGGVIEAKATYVGYGTNAHGNSIIVAGAGSALYNEVEFVLGDHGLYNRMTISYGGNVSVTGDAFVGKALLLTPGGWPIAGDNRVLVTGSGSVWTVTDELFIGHSGVGNELTIAAGGEVRAYRGVIGSSSDTGQQNNRLIVTGSNSLWAGSGPLVVGHRTSRNSLTVTNGGRVVNTDGSLGEFSQESDSADGNVALVTGSGSVWSNSGSLYVGRAGTSNSVAIRNGGAVFAGGDVYVGFEATAADNRIELVGGSLTLTNSGAGALDVRRGRLVLDGGDVNAGRLVMTNNTAGGNGSLFDFNHGTLNILAGSQIVAPAGADFVVGNSSGQTAAWNLKGGTNTVQPVAGNAARVVLGGAAGATGAVTVTGATTVWDIDGTLDVRRGTLTLDGGTLDAGMLIATNNTTGATNAMVRLHAGTLNSHGTLIVVPSGQNLNVGDVAGQTVAWNILNGTNGVFAVAGGSAGIHLGSVAGASADVLATGVGTVWSNGADLVVGQAGAGSRLTVTNGARVFNSLGLVGNQGTAGSNSVLVTGNGSVWINGSALVVGNGGIGNALTVSDAGRVVNGNGFIGHDTGASNNTVLVTDGGSVWTNALDLIVGNDGSGNSLILTNGGRAGVGGNSYVGYNHVARDNAVTVTGTGSVWNTTGYLAAGFSGAGSRLTITAGGVAVVAGAAYVGYAASASNTAILVTDAGSRMTLATNLHMGYGSAGNTLTVTNGGVLSVGGHAHIGNVAGAHGNTALVTGGGSVWSIAGEFLVGSNGVGNALHVVDGGRVENDVGYVGYAAGARSNVVLVSGSGAVWSNRFNLNVGFSGADNAMIVSNQGVVHSDRSYIGSNAGASNNAVLVTGAGSRWQTTSDVRVGSAGAGNTLTITNGGALCSAGGSVGTVAGACDNAAVVTGGGSVWSNSGTVQVGLGGAGNRLTIAGGGTVYNERSGIGWSAGASNNTVEVTGPGSVWNSSGYLYVGNGGWGSRLTIEDGGAVHAQSVTLGVAAGSSNNTLAIEGGHLVTTNAVVGGLTVSRGAVTLDGGSVMARTVQLMNGANGTFAMSGGTLAVHALTNDGSANLVLSGGTVRPLDAGGQWSAAITVSNTVTVQTEDAGGVARTTTLSGTVSGGGTLQISGTGALRMNGRDVQGGRFAVASGATLGGTGSAASVEIQANATLAAGNSIGIFTATNLTLDGGAHLQVEIDATHGVAGLDWDLVNVDGPAVLSGLSSSAPLTVDVVNFGGLDGATDPLAEVSWNILDASDGVAGYVSGAFAFTTTGLAGWTNGAWSVSQSGNSLLLSYSPIPEPATVTLTLLLGGALVGWRRRRRAPSRGRRAA